MFDALLTLESWDRSTVDDKVIVATQIAKALAPHFRFTRLEPYALGDQQHTIAFFVREGFEFALLPGYAGPLGYDSTHHVIPDLEEGEIDPSTWQAHLQRVLTPLRQVALRPFLLATSAERLEGPRIFRDGRWHLSGEPIRRSEVLAAITQQGYRFPTSDDWEYACSGGARTLFRWGNEWPPIRWDHAFRRAAEDWREDVKPNAFGLLIGLDPGDVEYCAEPTLLRGGDGGYALSVDAGFVPEWISFATPYCASFTEQFVEISRHSHLRRAFSLPEELLT